MPTRQEQKLCRPFLDQEIALVNPRLIILVGGLAIRLYYPAGTSLDQIVGSAAYFPPDTLDNPVNFRLADAQLKLAFDGNSDENGRWVVPLPHPSGASLWPNKPENKALIARAVRILRGVRASYQL